ncbi:SDR family oxidoreductase [Halomarina litorea]|uniref:SDR family oxidoreductase n=1 Tax=Halomarina litorea TaxID=2961595 RepID=UPI0020C59AC1|nr:SDR family NAD(P)-dependent oxidoreductase [Halomarina sp. BCD28]
MLSGKVCVVTGAGHGLGEAAAIELGRLGATVVVNDLGSDVSGEGADETPAESTAEAVREAGGEAMAHFGDVSSLDYTRELVADTVDEHGRLDGVANFAGVLRDALSYKMSEEEWDTVVQVHLRGHFALLRAAAAHWREAVRETGDDSLDAQRSFLAVSSRSALGNVGQMNYAAAKAGVLGLTRTAARELHRHDVRVNALMPTAYTRMIADIPEEKQAFTAEELPPEKVAPMVAYLMSDAAEDVTGCTVRAAGDEIGLVTDPETVCVGVSSGGWTAEAIAEQFREAVCAGEDLTKTGRAF